MKRVLVLQGGGARGLLQLKFLARLEQEEGKKISDMFDLICGTSVGAINAAVLSTGVSANEFYPIFKEGLEKIFKPTWWNFGGLFKPKYDRNNFNAMWTKLLDKRRLLGDTETDLMITSVDRVDDTNHYFRSWAPQYEDLEMCWAVKASFAAPYYFGQLVDTKRKAIWFDGGVGIANMPIDQAYTEAVRRGWLKKEKVTFTCVGTGIDKPVDREKEFKKNKNQSLKGQIADFMSPTDGGLARKQALQDQVNRYKILAGEMKNLDFRYIDGYTEGSMDDISDKTLESHEQAGEAMIKLAKQKKWKW
jgi:predicted acylesterase/phospholipase RssA